MDSENNSHCLYCASTIRTKGWISGYSIGGYDFQKIDIKIVEEGEE